MVQRQDIAAHQFPQGATILTMIDSLTRQRKQLIVLIAETEVYISLLKAKKDNIENQLKEAGKIK